MTKKSVLNKSVLKKLVLLSVVSNCLYTGIALAAEETSDSYTLDPIVVTAQRTETRDLETPAATIVLTKEDIKNTGAKTVFDAISFTTGITNFSYGAGGLDYGSMDSRVNIRGLERGALILINGAPINLNGKNSLSGILPENVERIEIVKGASSTLYGAEALGGVINIITSTPEKEYVKAKVGLGNLGYKQYLVSAGNKDFNIAVGKEFFGAIDRTSPNRKDLDGKRKYEYYNERGKGDLFNIALNAKLSERYDLSYMRSESNSTYGQIVVPGTLTKAKATEASESKRYHYDDKKNNFSLTYDYDNTKAVAFYTDRDLYGESKNLATNKWSENASNYLARKYGIDVQHEWSLRDNKDSFIGGLLVSRDTYKGTAAATSNVRAGRNNMALYGSYSYEINPKLTTILGARFQKISDPVNDQNVFMPQWQMLYKLDEQSSIYSNVGKAFTMPNLSDTFKYVNGGYQAISGPNLKPEEGWNYEVGYKHVTEKDSWKVALFYMDFKNFFDWAPDPDTGKNTVRINGGKFQNTGIELDYKHLLSDKLTLSLGTTYSNPKKQEIGVSTWNQAYPKLQFNAGLNYTDDKLDAGIALNWLTKRLKNRDGGTNPDLINLNAYVSYAFSKNDTVQINLNNILDRHNVITNGAWEYWDNPFNYTVSYQHTF